jgi:hypothetical protein
MTLGLRVRPIAVRVSTRRERVRLLAFSVKFLRTQGRLFGMSLRASAMKIWRAAMRTAIGMMTTGTAAT